MIIKIAKVYLTMSLGNLNLRNDPAVIISKNKKYTCDGFMEGPPIKFILIKNICDNTVRMIKISK